MYQDYYTGKIDSAITDKIKKLTQEIEKEKVSDKPNMNKIYKLEEQKYMPNLFGENNTFFSTKYRNPW